jgi:hypothetical protein
MDNDNNSDNYDDNINFDTIDIRNISIDKIVEHFQLNIVEVWTVNHFLGSKNQYLLVLEDGLHICSCMLLLHEGIICRHFFAILKYSKIAKFHISLVPIRWYNESKLVNNDINNLIENEPLLTSNAKDIYVPPELLKKTFKENYTKIISYKNLPAVKEESVEIKSSKERYFNLHNKFKTLIRYADDEENYNKLVKKIDEAYLYLKKEENDISDNEIRNPSKPRTKGRPKKRVYNSNKKQRNK